MWIEEKRNGCGDDIYQIKDFLLSSDNKLRRWDYMRSTNRVPIVMSPNQWLNIILHYVERTSDDYKSFVSFLTLTVRTDSLPIDMLSTIISGIAEATSDMEQQQSLVRNFIERNTFDEMEKMSEEELQCDAREFAMTELEKRILELESIQQEQINELAQTREIIKQTQSMLDGVMSDSANERRNIEQQLDKERLAKEVAKKETDDLRQELDVTKLGIWKAKKITLWGIILLISIICCVLVFIWQDKNWNFMAALVNRVDTLDSESTKQYCIVIITFPIIVVGYAIRMIIDAIDVDEYNKQNLRMFWNSQKS